MLERTIESDRLYVMDRGYAKFALFNKIVKANSSYACRLRDNSAYEVVESRELTDAATTAAPRCPAAGVLNDEIVLVGQSGKANACPDHRAPTAGGSRLVCVKCSPHTSRGKYKGTRAHAAGGSGSRQRRRVADRDELT